MEMNGNLLKELRSMAGITQTALAEALEMHQCDISDLETGRRDLTPEMYHRAALKIHELKAERDQRFAELSAGGRS